MPGPQQATAWAAACGAALALLPQLWALTTEWAQPRRRPAGGQPGGDPEEPAWLADQLLVLWSGGAAEVLAWAEAQLPKDDEDKEEEEAASEEEKEEGEDESIPPMPAAQAAPLAERLRSLHAAACLLVRCCGAAPPRAMTAQRWRWLAGGLNDLLPALAACRRLAGAPPLPM